MALKTYNVKESGQGQTIALLKKFVVVECSDIDNGDHIVLSQLTTVNEAYCYDLSDGAEFTATVSVLNTITIDTGDGDDKHVLIVAIGV